MSSFKQIEEIQVWQKARVVTQAIYMATSGGEIARDFGLRDQVRRASVSIMANIAEGFGRRSDKEFARFLDISQGSVCETLSHLYVAMDLGYLPQQKFDELRKTLDEVGRMLYALAKRLRTDSNERNT